MKTSKSMEINSNNFGLNPNDPMKECLKENFVSTVHGITLVEGL
jgi:hypothetical protein